MPWMSIKRCEMADIERIRTEADYNTALAQIDELPGR